MVRINTQKAVRMLFLLVADLVLLSISLYGAYWLRFEGMVPDKYLQVFSHTIWYFLVLKIMIFILVGLYSSMWKYAGIDELFKVFLACVISMVTVIGVTIYLPDVPLLNNMDFSVPRSIYIISFMVDLILVGGLRFSYRGLRRVSREDLIRNKHKRKVLIIGAGDAAAMVIKEMKNNPNSDYDPVAAIDDDPMKHKRRIYGVKVVGGRDHIERITLQKEVEEIIIAIPSLSNKDKHKLVQDCERTGLRIKTVPNVHDIITGRISILDIRPVEIEDLLGRQPVELDLVAVKDYLMGQKVLITGGGGSIGSELSRQIATYTPSVLYILDIYENNAYDIINELSRKHPDLKVEGIIASVRDQERINQIFDTIRPDVVFHAAAHKHVPLMEANPAEAIKNNVFGTFNVVEASNRYQVKRFVMISTDKAVNPTNVMGASKRLCEMIVEAFSNESATIFAVLRFGNVLGSNGSVIPLFKKQIEAGGPVTVTHPDIIRYFMTIPEAVQLVLQAGSLSKGGEVFVLDMGEPVQIDKLARDLIKLSGFEPDEDIQIVYTGLRPGEKLYEELLMSEEGLIDTPIEKIHIAKRMGIEMKTVIGNIKKLESVLDDQAALIEQLRVAVPTYVPEQVTQI